jgi:ubiquinone/menaquinone biosynthesis C-methylase UbiE
MENNQKNVWNKVAYSKEFTTPLQLDLLTSYIDKGASILDVGCGYGRTLHELYINGYKNLYGIDFSDKMIERAKNQHPYIHFDIKHSSDIDFEDKSFDAVILFAVLTCIINNEAQIYLINEIMRVLKPGGIIYINDFLLNTDSRNIERYQTFEKKYGTYGVFELSDGMVLRHHNMKWVETCLSPFQVLVFKPLSFPTMNGHTSNAYCFVGRNS